MGAMQEDLRRLHLEMIRQFTVNQVRPIVSQPPTGPTHSPQHPISVTCLAAEGLAPQSSQAAFHIAQLR